MAQEKKNRIHRRTRIVATLGPATDSPEVLRSVLLAGVDVARINFSHGTEEEHLNRIRLLRKVSEEIDKHVAILADLPGPKLRIKLLEPLQLSVNDEVLFTTHTEVSQPGIVAITEPEMLTETRTGQRILLDDGRFQLEVIRNDGDRVTTRVLVGGKLLPNKGVNLPDTELKSAAVTDRDLEAIKIIAKADVDWVALSFARTPQSATELRNELYREGINVPVLAKIERPEAIARAAAIIDAFDGIMVARGDLGVEIPLERVPTVQKRLIALARTAGKPVITATDMLDSMRQNPRPTRAEAGDVANAIYDGTDAVMLSGETAVGQFPLEAVTCMHQIALEAETHLHETEHPMTLQLENPKLDDFITKTVVDLADQLHVDAIITPTLSGRTARLISRHRPTARVIAPAPSANILRQMSVSWGLVPVLMDYCRRSGDDRMGGAVRAAYEAKVVQPGELVIVLAGHPIEGGQYLPTVRVLRIGFDGKATEP